MKLENYVCTLEQAKKLKELAVKQEDALYYWVGDGYLERNEEKPWLFQGYESNERLGAAFTSQELCELIDEFVDKNDNFWTYKKVFGKDKSFYYFFIDYEKDSRISFTFNSEAQARAEFLIHLLENKK